MEICPSGEMNFEEREREIKYMNFIISFIMSIITFINFSYIIFSVISNEVKTIDLLIDNWEYANYFGKIILISGFIFLIPSTVIILIYKLAFLFIEHIIKLGFSSETALERHIYSVDIPEPFILDHLREQKIEFIIGKDRLYLPSNRVQKKCKVLIKKIENKRCKVN